MSFEEKNIMLSYVKAEGLQKGIHGLDKTSIEDFSTWYELYCLTLDATIEDEVLVLGSKKTNQTDYLPQLLDNGTKIIYMVRDPRDIILSSRNRFSWFQLYNQVSNLKSNFDNLKRMNGHENLCVLKYEDLILSPKDSCVRLSEFLNTSVTHELTEFKFRNSNEVTYTENSSFGDLKKLFDSNAVYRWKKRLSDDQEMIDFVSAEFDDFISEQGYEAGFTKSRNAFAKSYQNFQKQQRYIRLASRISKGIISRLFPVKH